MPITDKDLRAHYGSKPDRLSFASAGAVPPRTQRSDPPPIDTDALIDLARNVAGLDEGWLNNADLTAMRHLVREYRAQARAICDHIDARGR